MTYAVQTRPSLDLSEYLNNSNGKPSIKPVYVITDDRISTTNSSRTGVPSIPRMIELDECFGFILGNYIERAIWAPSGGSDTLAFAVFGDERLDSVCEWFKKYQIADSESNIFQPCAVGWLLHVYSPILMKVLKNMVTQAYHRRKLHLPYFTKDSPMAFRIGLFHGLFHQHVEYHSRRNEHEEPHIECSKSLSDDMVALMNSIEQDYRVEENDSSARGFKVFKSSIPAQCLCPRHTPSVASVGVIDEEVYIYD